MKKPDFGMEYVEWFDSTSIDEWTDVYDLMETPAHTIRTVGFLINEDDDTLILALNFDQESEQASCVIYIPKSLVTKRHRVMMGSPLRAAAYLSRESEHQ